MLCSIDASFMTRNLRIREDTAKYLLNLDVNSAHYDPKTRSMREDPLPDMDPNEKFYAVSAPNQKWDFTLSLSFVIFMFINSLVVFLFRAITKTELVVKHWSSSSLIFMPGRLLIRVMMFICKQLHPRQNCSTKILRLTRRN